MLLLFFLFLCFPFIFCQSSDFACNGIRNNFIIFDKSNLTVLKGNFDFFTTKTDDGKTKLVVKPMEITYNVNNTVYSDFNIGAYSFYNNDNVECNYQEINNTKYYIFDMGRINVFGSFRDATSKQNVQIAIVDFNIDQGIINLENGTYIGEDNGNNLSPYSQSLFNFVSYINSSCINYSRLPNVNHLLPRCNQIIGDVMFYNISNNYSIVASLNIIFTLGYKMNVAGIIRPSTESCSIWLNDDYGYGQSNNVQNFTQNFSDDSKFKLSIFSESLLDYRYAYIGKIIHRNGVVLMEEDRPFTPDDICQDIPAVKLAKNPELIIVPSLCCSNFESE